MKTKSFGLEKTTKSATQVRNNIGRYRNTTASVALIPSDSKPGQKITTKTMEGWTHAGLLLSQCDSSLSRVASTGCIVSICKQQQRSQPRPAMPQSVSNNNCCLRANDFVGSPGMHPDIPRNMIPVRASKLRASQVMGNGGDVFAHPAISVPKEVSAAELWQLSNLKEWSSHQKKRNRRGAKLERQMSLIDLDFESSYHGGNNPSPARKPKKAMSKSHSMMTEEEVSESDNSDDNSEGGCGATKENQEINAANSKPPQQLKKKSLATSPNFMPSFLREEFSCHHSSLENFTALVLESSASVSSPIRRLHVLSHRQQPQQQQSESFYLNSRNYLCQKK